MKLYSLCALLSIAKADPDTPRGKGTKGGIFGKGYSNYVINDVKVKDIDAVFFNETVDVSTITAAISVWDMEILSDRRIEKKDNKEKVFLPPKMKKVKDKALDDGEMLYYASPIVPSLTFEGLSNIDNTDVNGHSSASSPGDPIGAVGHKYYVQAVNDLWGIYDKQTGNIEVGPRSLASLFGDGFPVEECVYWGFGDPSVVYDADAKVFLLAQLTSGCWVDDDDDDDDYHYGVAQCYNCVAVLDEESLTVQRFALPYPTLNAEGDYPRFAVYGDYYLLTANGWRYDANDDDKVTYDGTVVYVINKHELFDNGVVSYATFSIPPQYYVYTLLPADNDSAPPQGSTIPLVSLSYGFPSLRVFEISMDFVAQTGTLMQVEDFQVANFNFVGPCSDASIDCTVVNSCPPSYFDCIPQPGVSKESYLHPADDRLMHRLAYQNFGDYESMVVSHSVSVGKDSLNNTIASIRWYEIIRQQDDNGKFSLKQQGTFAPNDGVSRFMPSVAQDKFGNIAMGYTVSDAFNVYPGIRVTGRRRNDPDGKMSFAEGIIVDGIAAQEGEDIRLGDYSSMSIDPEDGCTFYHTNMHYYSSSEGEIEDNCEHCWKTKVSKFSLPGCD